MTMVKLFRTHGEWLVKIWVVLLGIALFMLLGSQFHKIHKESIIKPSEIDNITTIRTEENYVFNDNSNNDKSDNIWKFTTSDSLDKYSKDDGTPLDVFFGKERKTQHVFGLNDKKLIHEINTNQLSGTKYKVARINDDYAIITEFGDYKASKSDIYKALKQLVTDNNIQKEGV